VKNESTRTKKTTEGGPNAPPPLQPVYGTQNRRIERQNVNLPTLKLKIMCSSTFWSHLKRLKGPKNTLSLFLMGHPVVYMKFTKDYP